MSLNQYLHFLRNVMGKKWRTNNQDSPLIRKINLVSGNVCMIDNPKLFKTFSANFTIKTPRLKYEPITGQSATLVVEVIIGKATKVSWYKNNNLIDTASNSRYSGGNYQTPSLTINRVDLDDAGSYMASVTEGRDKRNTSVITVSPKGWLINNACIIIVSPKNWLTDVNNLNFRNVS